MIRHRVATLGRPGPAWPRAVARWGSSAVLAVEATTCMTPEELRALVRSTPLAAAVVEVGLPGVDRSLADEVRRAGVALIVVEGPALAEAARRLEPDGVLAPDFGPEALAAVLETHARARCPDPAPPPAGDGPEPGVLVAVTGPGGTGASTVAQALASAHARRAPALLADLALDADQHLRHGVDPHHDGVFELAEALRHRPPEEVVAPVVPQSPGYGLLCGLRRRQEWTALSAPTAEHLVDVLRRLAPVVVADVAADTDGGAEVGSVDIEDRNALARTVVAQACVVVVVGRGSTTGIHRLVRTLLELTRFGVPHDRLRAVLNGGRRSATRAELTVRSTHRLLAAADDGPWPVPVWLPHDRRVEACVREAGPLPRRLVDRVGAAVGGPP